MNRQFSVYLDLVRFLAALLVYVYHSNQRFLIESVLPASNFGHSSVIVFFVLSGFVIAFVTATKESTWASYAASRIARVFSVTVPTIVLTLALDSVGRSLYPEIYAGYPYDQFLLRIIGSVLMLNEVWLISITSFSNVPYWSICYEWWYYVTFAMVIFLPARVGLLVASITLLALGPKLILLAPIWWLGVLLYHWRFLRELSLGASWLLVVVSICGIVLYHVFGVGDWASDGLKGVLGDDLHRSMTFSKFFVADYLLGILVFMNFAGVRNLAPFHGRFMLSIEKPVRFVANYTFTLYLLHQPLFLFWGAVVHGDPKGPWYWLSVSVLMFFSVGLMGYFTENRRTILRRMLFSCFKGFSPAAAKARSSLG